jgi:hypothetical protein
LEIKEVKNMEFKIIMQSETEHAVHVESREIGIAGLEYARAHLGIPDLPARLLESTIRYLREDLHIPVSESIARDSGHFVERCVVTVTTAPFFLNQYVDRVVKAKRNTETDEIQKVRMVWVTDEDAVLNAWIDAGYPLEWGMPEVVPDA